MAAQQRLACAPHTSARPAARLRRSERFLQFSHLVASAAAPAPVGARQSARTSSGRRGSTLTRTLASRSALASRRPPGATASAVTVLQKWPSSSAGFTRGPAAAPPPPFRSPAAEHAAAGALCASAAAPPAPAPPSAAGAPAGPAPAAAGAAGAAAASGSGAWPPARRRTCRRRAPRGRRPRMRLRSPSWAPPCRGRRRTSARRPEPAAAMTGGRQRPAVHAPSEALGAPGLEQAPCCRIPHARALVVAARQQQAARGVKRHVPHRRRLVRRGRVHHVACAARAARAAVSLHGEHAAPRHTLSTVW